MREYLTFKQNKCILYRSDMPPIINIYQTGIFTTCVANTAEKNILLKSEEQQGNKQCVHGVFFRLFQGNGNFTFPEPPLQH